MPPTFHLTPRSVSFSVWLSDGDDEMAYGYDPYRGTEQFYDCELPAKNTAPITFWMRDHAKQDFVDVEMPDGHVIRAVYGEVADMYVQRGGQVLPD